MKSTKRKSFTKRQITEAFSQFGACGQPNTVDGRHKCQQIIRKWLPNFCVYQNWLESNFINEKTILTFVKHKILKQILIFLDVRVSTFAVTKTVFLNLKNKAYCVINSFGIYFCHSLFE